MSESKINLRQRFIHGTIWMLVGKWLERLLGLVSILILARILIPADFGLVSMAAPVVGLVELFGSIGVDAALIQKQNITREHYDTAWTLRVITAFCMATVLWIIAPLGAQYFREPRLEEIIRWMAIGTAIQGFENIGLVAYRKAISLHRDVMLMLSKKLASLVVTTIFALLLNNYWALVIGILFSRITGIFTSYMLSAYKPRFSLIKSSELTGFSLWMLCNGILGFLHLRANDLIVGRILGPATLAHFNISMELLGIVTGEIMVSVGRAAYPTYAKLTDDRQRLRHAFKKVIAVLGVIGLPAALGMAAIAKIMIFLLLGEKWMPAADLISGLALPVTAFCLLGQFNYIFMALGHPRGITFAAFGGVIVMVAISLAILPYYGTHALPFIYAAYTIILGIGYFIRLRIIFPEFTPQDWVSPLWRSTIGALTMYVTVKWTLHIMGDTYSFQRLIILIVVGILGYSVMLFLLWFIAKCPEESPETLLLAKVKELFNKLSGWKLVI